VKKPIKVLLGLFTLLCLMIMLIFAINWVDEPLSEEARSLSAKFPAQAGVPLKSVRMSSKDLPTRYESATFQEYVKNQTVLDSALEQYRPHVEKLLKAFEVGKIELNPDFGFSENLGIYNSRAHQLFYVLVSQNIKDGKVKEAYALLEQSNRFLVNIVETPQTYLNVMIALATLKENALYLKSLNALKLRPLPSTLIASFHISKSAAEIYETCSRFEFRMFVVLLEEMPGLPFNSTNTNQLIVGMVSEWPWLQVALSKLRRRNQTLNWMAQIRSEMLLPECHGKETRECSKTYREQVDNVKWAGLLINPTGRELIKIFDPMKAPIREKMEAQLKFLNAVAPS